MRPQCISDHEKSNASLFSYIHSQVQVFRKNIKAITLAWMTGAAKSFGSARYVVFSTIRMTVY